MAFSSARRQSPIAIVGIGGLFPGSVDVARFWTHVLRGTDLITDVPATHWSVEHYYDADPKAPDKTYARRGGFLPEVPFDSLGFGIPPSLFSSTDTSQLLGLMVARVTLQDCFRGQLDDSDKSRVSVLLGCTGGQELFGQMASRLAHPNWRAGMLAAGIEESLVDAAMQKISDTFVPWTESTFPGLLGNVVAGRIANRLDLGGTNAVTDAACASSFAALSMAIDELVLGRADVVLTGGVDTLNDIFMHMCFSKTPALSDSGDCRPFDEKADGTLLGEGLGMVALKRLDDAERDGNHIYAVVKGLGTSSDGRSKSVYAPVPEGQAQALKRAYQAAGYGPETVELVEAHGTGTKAGDVAELAGLKLAFGDCGRDDPQWCAVGSVKSQIGHTKAAAGAAGLLKAALALHHKVLPPTIKVDKPNPRAELEKSPFYVSPRVRPWVRSSSHPRRASVSSFGFGGSNFHVTLEEYTGSARAPRMSSRDVELFCLSAPDTAGLERRIGALSEKVAKAGPDLSLAELARASHEAFDAGAAERLAFSASSLADLSKKLGDAARALSSGTKKAPGLSFGSGAALGKVAFVFPGQGSQSLEMGAGVAMAFEQSLSAFDDADDVRLGEVPLSRVVFPPPAFGDDDKRAHEARLTQTEWAQPALGAASVAFLRALEGGLGLSADMMGGHSYGELTALYAAGAFDYPSLLKLARRRGELMAEAARVPGGMVAVSGPVEKVREVLASTGVSDVVLANHNAPDQAVLSGALASLDAVVEKMKAAGLKTRALQVATGFHSPLVAPASDALLGFLDDVTLADVRVPVFANATAAAYPADAREKKRVLAEQVRSPVRFVDEIQAMYDAGARVFVEVGPGRVLTGLVTRILEDQPHVAVSLDGGAKGLQPFFDGLARLLAAGMPLRLSWLWEHLSLTAPGAPLAGDDKKPALLVPVGGANAGRPTLPAPMPAAQRSPLPAVTSSIAAAPALPAVVSAPAARPSAISPAAAPVFEKPMASRDPLPRNNGVSPSVAPVTTSPTQARTAPPLDAGWLTVFREGQQQTADAHASFQRSMADAHQAFLRAFEASTEQLSQLVGGAAVPAAPVTVAAVTAAAVPSSPRTNGHEAPAFMTTPLVEATRSPASTPAPTLPTPTMSAPVPMAPAAPARAAAAPATPVTTSNAAPPTADLTAALLAVVAEKTGYPIDALAPSMSLEADLGVDSIKRVEILGALREKVPSLPEVDAMQLAQLSTLGEIAGALGSVPSTTISTTTSGVAPTISEVAKPASLPVASGADVAAVFLDVVADKTGYPKEALALEMSLEADLGIDSIKRVEILGAVRQRMPALPEVDAMQLAQLSTLGEIVGALSSSNGATARAAAPVAPAAAASALPGGDDVAAVFLDVVADKTGYPKEALALEMSLEADLGIDSIKRVEILGAVRQRMPALPEVDAMQLAQLSTLGEIVGALASTSAPSAPAPAASNTNGVVVAKAAPGVVRAEVVLVPASATRAPLSLTGGRVLVVDDGAGLASAVARELELRGARAEILSDSEGASFDDVAGVLDLGGLAQLSAGDGDEAALGVLRRSFDVARQSARALQASPSGSALYCTVQDLGGSFGLTTAPTSSALLGGLAALTKTAAQEWSGVRCKALDVDSRSLSPADLARLIVDEAIGGVDAVEVGARGGERFTLVTRAAPLSGDTAPALGDRPVVVATGGARGVTATSLEALAERCPGARLVLLGRTDVDAELSAPEASLSDEAALKQALFASAKAAGESVTPAQVGARAGRILAAQEVRRQLERFRQRGAEVLYLPVDVRDATALRAALERARSTFGPITGVVHGAGVLADKRLEDKTLAQFDLVTDTKVRGLLSLLDATANDPLRFLALFSSVAGRFGNVGQADYAMANEALNKLARREQGRRGASCIVKSYAWGPWEGGMVTPALRKVFESRGVALLSLADGARFFVDELSRAASGKDVEVVFGGPLTEQAAGQPLASSTSSQTDDDDDSVATRVDSTSFGFLSDHSLRGTPVLPVVFAMELMARAAERRHPGMKVRRIHSLRVLRGLPLSGFSNGGNELKVRLHPETPNGSGAPVRLRAEVFADGGAAPRYIALVDVGESLEKAPAAPTPPATLAPFLVERAAMYRDMLFHGPRFQLVDEVKGASDDGILAVVRGTRGADWDDDSYRLDVGALDAGLQLVVLFGRIVLGAPFLPTGFERFTSYVSELPKGPMRCVTFGRAEGRDRVRLDLFFVDDDDRVLMAMTGVEAHRLLDDDAFRSVDVPKAVPVAS